MTLLDVVIFLPLIAFLIILVLPKESKDVIRTFSLVASTAIFLISLGLLGPFWFNSPGKFVFETDIPWIDSPAIHYHVAIDGISLFLVILTTLLTPICVLVSWLPARPQSSCTYSTAFLPAMGTFPSFPSTQIGT